MILNRQLCRQGLLGVISSSSAGPEELTEAPNGPSAGRRYDPPGTPSMTNLSKPQAVAREINPCDVPLAAWIAPKLELLQTTMAEASGNDPAPDNYGIS